MSRNSQPRVQSAPVEPPPSLETSLAKRFGSRWLREMEEREALVEERELNISEQRSGMSHEVKLLEGHIQAKQAELAALEQALENKQSDGRSRLSHLEREIARIQKEATSKSEALGDLGAEIEAAKNRLQTVEQERAQLEAEIKQRRGYLSQQEELIEKTVQEGNEAVNVIHREAQKLQAEKEGLLLQLQEYRQTFAKTQKEIEAANELAEQLNERYQGAIAEYREELSKVKDETKQIKTENAKSRVETDQRLLDLKTREAEVAIARGVIARQREDLEADRRRLASQRALDM